MAFHESEVRQCWEETRYLHTDTNRSPVPLEGGRLEAPASVRPACSAVGTGALNPRGARCELALAPGKRALPYVAPFM